VPHTHARRLAHAFRRGRRAAAAVAAVTVAAGPLALGAPAQQALAQSARDQHAAGPSVVIEGISPQWAQPGHTVTVTGIVRNGTAAPVSGLSILLRSSADPLIYRDDLSQYSAGELPQADAPEGTPVVLPGVIEPGQSMRWKAVLNPDSVGMIAFGVYPLAAQLLNDVDLPVATDRTFLPFWPASDARPQQKLSIAWVWPILDRPYQGVCRALLSNGLAASMAPGGRLSDLLAAGQSYSAAAQLTWAIDPALAQTAKTMSHPYTADAGPGCGGATAMRADRSAGTWLNELTSAISGQQAFVTPYADVDVDALSHVGLNTDLRNAFAEGRTVGSQLLHLPASAGTTAWPPSGLADSGILTSLAINQVKTVVLNSSVMPPAGPAPSYTPAAQASADSGIGSSLRVLLADQTISKILAVPTTGPAAKPGSAFATQQSFLAQTAMIVAELPNTARSLVVTPPRTWNPAPGLADGLLSETVNAPWLHPDSLASLAADPHPTGEVARRAPPAHHVSPDELPQDYLARVASLGAAVRLQASTFSPSDPGYLQNVIAALESADWPGSRAQADAARRKLLSSTLGYVGAQAKKVSIIDSGQYTLGGSSAKIPVSVTNDMTRTVRVVLHASADGNARLSIGPFHSQLTIAAGHTTTIPLPLHSHSVGVTDVTLSLDSPNGTPLPKTTVQLSVRATRFGTLALVIMCVALAVFVLASSARAIRRSRRDGGEQHGEDGETSDPPGPAAIPGSVGSSDDLENDHPPEDPDEYADARGRARR
jgi:Family of unknown function (DUF6049)